MPGWPWLHREHRDKPIFSGLPIPLTRFHFNISYHFSFPSLHPYPPPNTSLISCKIFLKFSVLFCPLLILLPSHTLSPLPILSLPLIFPGHAHYHLLHSPLSTRFREGISPTQLLPMYLEQRLCTEMLQSLHLRPCLKTPFSCNQQQFTSVY